jgi:hypothetical protein
VLSAKALNPEDHLFFPHEALSLFRCVSLVTEVVVHFRKNGFHHLQSPLVSRVVVLRTVGRFRPGKRQEATFQWASGEDSVSATRAADGRYTGGRAKSIKDAIRAKWTAIFCNRREAKAWAPRAASSGLSENVYIFEVCAGLMGPSEATARPSSYLWADAQTNSMNPEMNEQSEDSLPNHRAECVAKGLALFKDYGPIDRKHEPGSFALVTEALRIARHN